jgi:ABC-type bacteriocin/lantibiotic exporter with double-glycine peptidase domain
MPYNFYQNVILPIRRNLQDTKYDCGPASLEIILETLGRDIREKTLMRIAHTTLQGTSPENIAHTLRKLKIKHQIIPHGSIALIEEKIRNFNLCLVNYQAWGENGAEIKNLDSGHYSVIFGFTPTHFFVADPAKRHTVKYNKQWGFRTIKKNLFSKRWRDKEENGEKTFHWMLAVPLNQ